MVLCMILTKPVVVFAGQLSRVSKPTTLRRDACSMDGHQYNDNPSQLFPEHATTLQVFEGSAVVVPHGSCGFHAQAVARESAQIEGKHAKSYSDGCPSVLHPKTMPICLSSTMCSFPSTRTLSTSLLQHDSAATDVKACM